MTSRDPHRRAPRGTHSPSASESTRPRPADARPADPSTDRLADRFGPEQGVADPVSPPADPVAPVNPGAWDTRSWTLVDEADGAPAESGPEPLDAWPTASGEGAEVVWPEAGHAGTPALDAEGVPLAEPPTGPLHAVDPPPPRRRAAATPTRAPSPAPPAPETRLRTGSFGLPESAPDTPEPVAGRSGRAPLTDPPGPVSGPGPGRPARGATPGHNGGGAEQNSGVPVRNGGASGASARPSGGVRVTGPRAPAAEARARGGPAHHLTVEDEVPRRPGADGAHAAGRSSPSSVPPADRVPEEIRQPPPAPRPGVHANQPDGDAASRSSADDGRLRSPADTRRPGPAREGGQPPSAPPASGGRRRRSPGLGGEADPLPAYGAHRDGGVGAGVHGGPTGEAPGGEGRLRSAGRPGAPAGEGAVPPGDGARWGTRAPSAPRGGSADPVRELMHRHRALCERAVDPLEIAAGLEAHGITDRTAARYRHRDVFSLAEELYVRVPRAEEAAVTHAAEAGEGGSAGRGRVRAAARALSHLLPGALCAATVVGLTHVPFDPPYARPAVGALGGLAALAAVRLSLRGVPRTRTAGLWACWLLGYVLYGDWLLTELLAEETRAGRFLPVLGCLCVPLALALGVAPAAWTAHLFAVRARRRLANSRSLGDFASGVRPLLLLAVGLFAVALSAVQAAAHLGARGVVPPHATQAATAALGVLLFVALLLSRHGFPRAASVGLATACLLIAAALGSVLAARLPGAAAVGRPVEQAVAAYGPTVVPAVACAVAALALLAHGLRVLTGASAHQRPVGGPGARRLPRQATAGQGPAPGPAPRGVQSAPSGDRVARQDR